MKYPIRREFGIYRHFRPPMTKAAWKLAKHALALCPKGRLGELSVEKVSLPCPDGASIGALFYRGKDEPNAALLYLHGGGFVFRGAPYHYRLAREYALKAGVEVLFADYRLAFDTPAGTPLSDCETAYRFLLDRCGRERPVLLGGDSAGGYLCLSLIDRCRKEGLRMPDGLMLVYPVVDPKMSSPTMKEFPDTPMWNAKCNAAMWKVYGGQAFDPLSAELSNFPPVYLETAECDCLRGEGKLLARKLEEAGVSSTLNGTKGTMHGFDICKKSLAAKEAIGKRIKFLKNFNGGRQ